MTDQSIFSLKKAYGIAKASPNSSTLALDLLLSPQSAQYQNDLVNELLLAPHFREFPPSREFRRMFWKCVVEYLEAGGEEADERIYDAYLNLLSTRSSSFEIRPPSPSYNTHFWFSGPVDGTKASRMRLTTLLESRTMIEGGTTGLRTWRASLEFASWLVGHPDLVQGRRVLELGSGAGFLGLTMATLQMDRLDNFSGISLPTLVLSDINSDVLSRCRQNFLLPCNRMESHPSLDFRLLDWSDALDSEGNLDFNSAVNETLKDVDIIVGADLVYDASIVPSLVAVLALFFRVERAESSESDTKSLCAYIAITVRREQTVSVFLSTLLLYSLQYEEINMSMAPAAHKQFLGGVDDSANCTMKLIKITSAS
ncbi:hypothetical protein JB92DRAFT_3107263 [Gautieria morchelliformis]|nr:hypothetical protein JB92DRAFT_3107263 [Gautieria morchelliformis]